MDLTRLYNLTTPELREEAERLGVPDTYAMSRGQLIHAIRSHVGSPPEGLLGKVLGFAKWALQTTAAVAPEPDDEPATKFSRPSEVPVPSVGTENEAGAGSEPAVVREPAAGSEPAVVREPAAGSEPAVGSAPAAGSSSRPPAGVFSHGAGSFEEPFPTRTMARILADQGHFKRSLAIYAKLLEDHPADGELHAEAEEVRTRSRARRSELQ